MIGLPFNEFHDLKVKNNSMKWNTIEKSLYSDRMASSHPFTIKAFFLGIGMKWEKNIC